MQRIVIEPVQRLDYTTLEEIKRLRTNLHFIEPDQDVINITSTVGKEGKSMISFWLAHSLAELGKKVVLLDANIRNKEKQHVFTLNDKHSPKGLTEYLQGNLNIDEVVYETNITNLHILFSGNTTSNPSELLSSSLLKDLVIYLKDKYDYVIVDTPALGEVTDASIIAAHCDSTILVVEPGVTSYKLAQKAKEQLEYSGTKLLGVVLNKVL